MTNKELKLAAELLRLSADRFANHICNDIDDDLFKGWTKAEKEELAKDYERVNSNLTDWEKGDVITEDWIAMLAMAQKIEAHIRGRF
jgi:hypothetical protein